MDRGWVKLWRKSLDSQIWQNAELWHLWCWCILKATHKPIWVKVRTGKGFTEVNLERGQFIFGRNQAAKELHQKPSSIYKRLLKLKNLQNLIIQDNNQFSIVTICNYDLYQPEKEEEGTTKGTTKEQPSSTNKNKEHLEKEIKKPSSLPKKDLARGGCVPEIPYKEIIDDLNEKAGKHFSPATKDTREHINARWREGYRLDDFKQVNTVKSAQWRDDPHWNKFLRPSTLYNSEKFEGYLNENTDIKPQETPEDQAARENNEEIMRRLKEKAKHD
ncbi:MAG: conserved phage C-terminal domain-containing protein [bacterium]